MTPPTVRTLLQGNWLDSNQGGIAFCAVLLVEATGADGRPRRIVVDPGSSGRERALVESLGRLGLAPGNIDDVVLTHGHWDHIQNFHLFPGATVHLHRDELAYLPDPHPGDFATPAWTSAALATGRVQPVLDGDRLADGVEIMAVPGHSAGTIAVTVHTVDGVAVIPGDALQAARVAVTGHNALVFWNQAQADRSVARILERADVVYPGHDRPFRHRPGESVEYLEPNELVLTGPATDLDTLVLRPTTGVPPLVFEPGGPSGPR